MEKTGKYKQMRRQTAFVSPLGITQLHLRKPWVIAWWSMAFPGFGHLLLSKYLRGFLLIGWELYINSEAHINDAMVYSFCGQFALAKDVLEVRWMCLYTPVYLFAIYDSYRTSVDLNHIYVLANSENAPFTPFEIGTFEINYLDKRNPWLALTWSFLMPGMGQLYIHRIMTAFFSLATVITTAYISHVLDAIQYSYMGEFAHAKEVAVTQWLLFIPSIWGFSIYDAYTNAVENNKLFDKEQKRFLQENYQEKKVDHVQVISSFDHSTYLELAINALEQSGIAKSNIIAVPLDKGGGKANIIDTIDRSDGVSLIDTGMVLATALSVVCASIGFVLEWGPIIWGLIGAGTGFLIGLGIDIWVNKKKNKKHLSKGKNTEVFVLVNCNEEQSEVVETIFWKYLALGVATLQ
jgi:hypothetical protein